MLEMLVAVLRLRRARPVRSAVPWWVVPERGTTSSGTQGGRHLRRSAHARSIRGRGGLAGRTRQQPTPSAVRPS
jgi:hypothetical protein